MTARRRGEFARIAQLWAPLAAGFPGAAGLADDAALLTPPPGMDLVATTDALVEGMHFLADDPPESIAAKLLRVSLSDLAAKGAAPHAYLLTTAWPEGLDESWIERFARGLALEQARFGLALAGGDTVATTGPTLLSLTAFGLLPTGSIVRRAGARAGDALVVTGTIGDAHLGLLVAQGRLGGREELVARYRVPEPPVALAEAVRTHASAALDVSDGLLADLDHLCAASGLAARVALAMVPLSPEVTALVAENPALRLACVTGGDDYQILAATPEPERLIAAARALGIRATVIGRLEAGAAVATLVDEDGRTVTPTRRGWQHGKDPI